MALTPHKMVDLALNIFLTLLAFIGFLFNTYIVVSVGMTKQICRPGNLFLFHMSLIFMMLTLLFLCFSTPAIFIQDTSDSEGEREKGLLCAFQAFANSILHPLALWTIAGVHLDRFISIAYPLRYSSMISFRKSAFFLAVAWISVITISIPPIMISSSYNPRPWVGGCNLDFASSKSSSWSHAGAVTYFLVAILVPLSVVIGFNFRIVRIAKYHQYRIANALFGLTPGMGTDAQRQLSEGAKARKQQMDALKRFEGANAVGTLTQLVGSLCFFYIPFYGILCVYEDVSGQAAKPAALKTSLFILMLSPICNSFLFGFRNKTVQMKLINYARKEFYKNEVQKEIRQRSPGLGVSNRPSVSSIVGQITCQVPYLQRHLSEVSLHHNPGRVRSTRRKTSPGSMMCLGQADRSHGNGTGRRHPPPMVRHVSDLSWRVTAALGNSVRRSESSVTVDKQQYSSRLISGRDGNLTRRVSNGESQSDDESYSEEVFENTYFINDASRGPKFFFPSEDVIAANRFNQNLDDSNDSESPERVTSISKPTSRRPSLTSFKYQVPPSPSPMRPLSSAIKNILQGSGKRSHREKGPKITITRVPSIDQSSLEFLYPFQTTSAEEELATTSTIVYLEGDRSSRDATTTTTRSFLQRELQKTASFSKDICDKVVLSRSFVIVHAEQGKDDFPVQKSSQESINGQFKLESPPNARNKVQSSNVCISQSFDSSSRDANSSCEKRTAKSETQIFVNIDYENEVPNGGGGIRQVDIENNCHAQQQQQQQQQHHSNNENAKCRTWTLESGESITKERTTVALVDPITKQKIDGYVLI